MVAEQHTIPTPALVLGLGGLVPFAAASLLVWLSGTAVNSQLATGALGAYGAVILSFLGGVRWGNLLGDTNKLNRWLPLSLSVMPSLIAWPALLLPPVAQLVLLCAGFMLQYQLDSSAAKRGELPAWFLRLRLILTSGAITSLLFGLLGNLI